MYWQYRIVKKLCGKRDEDGKLVDPESPYNEYYYGVHEVYFDHNDKATMCTVDPISIGGDTIGEAAYEWLEIMKAFSKPFLNFDQIPEEGAYNEVTEIRDELMNEDGNINQEKIENFSTLQDIREKYDLGPFDIREYRNEQAVEQLKGEKEYTEKMVGKPISEVLTNIIELYGDSEEEEDE